MQSWKCGSSRGILILLIKIEVVNNLLVLINFIELLFFLNYYRDNIQNYVDMCVFIYDEVNVKGIWLLNICYREVFE